jgi:prenylcysteine oxidase/farnesylcysteine lyase
MEEPCDNVSVSEYITSVGSYIVDPGDNTTVYKIFSREYLDSSKICQVFDCVEDSQIHTKLWKAYPKFSVPEYFLPFELDDRGLFYTNAFENAFSCMEGQALAGRNVAALVLKYATKLRNQDSCQDECNASE